MSAARCRRKPPVETAEAAAAALPALYPHLGLDQPPEVPRPGGEHPAAVVLKGTEPEVIRAICCSGSASYTKIRGD